MGTALQRMMKRRGGLLLLIFLLIGVDQLTKAIVRRTLAHEAPLHFGFLTLLYTTNRGAFLSIGSNLPPNVRTAIFSGIVAIVLGGAAIALFRGSIGTLAEEIAVAAIIGGGVGNLIDRLMFNGRVTDFLYLASGPLHTGVFNVADMAITFGIVWLVVAWGFARRSTPGRNSM